MKKRQVAAASAIIGLALGGGTTLLMAEDDLGSDGNMMSDMSSSADESTVGASGAAFEEAAIATGNTNTADMSNAIFDACTSGDNVGSQFQGDCSVLIRGGTTDPRGTTGALVALTPDQVLATNVAAEQQVRSGIGVATSRMLGARLASGISSYRPGEALASQLLFDQGAGGGASADALFGKMGAFATIKYLNAEQDSDGYTYGFDQDGWDFMVGADYRVQPNLVVGAMASYAQRQVDYKANRGDMDVKGWGLAAYGTYFLDNGLFFEGIAGYMRNDYDLKRRINYSIAVDNVTTTVNQVAKADTDADVFYATFGGGYSVARGSFTFTPQASLNYSRNAVDGYRESMSNPQANGGSFAMAVNSQTYKSLTSRLGFMLANAFSTKVGVFVPQLSIDWVHEFADDQESLNTRFINDASRTVWSTETSEPDRNYFDVGIGLSGQLPGGFSGFVAYNQLLGYDDVDSYTITGGVRFEF